ncbi:hypothetical protein HQQ94_05110 [Shewanella sp. VB17]|uniref:hypothetical protein n=1 Tax=Shewanella sp. VB17 TaxID=2739432 RepID=UPI001566B8B6|nr:hypothetical protein [Shewanella sp. VB17]NRD72634.1 hypothetical protein [Shewanella sp. VB17]
MLDDWKFWSFLVALIALVLSQCPPIAIWFKKAKIELELYSRVCLTHKIGNPHLQIHLILRNVGGRKVRIKNIRAIIEREKNEVANLLGQNYVPDPSNNSNVLLTSFSLAPDEEWSNLVNVLNFFGREEEKSYRDSEKKLKERIFELKKAKGNEVMCFAEDSYVLPFNEIFDSKFIWKPGEYKLSISIETDTPEVNLIQSYRFILYESQSEDMVLNKKDFNTGAGIYWDKPEHSGVVVQLEEING